MSDPSSSEEQSTPLRRWGGGDVVIGMVVAILMSSLLTAAYQLTVEAFGNHSSQDGGRTFGLTVAAFLGLWSGWLGVPIVVSRLKGTGSLEVDFGLAFRWVDVPLGMLISAAGTLLTILIYLPLEWIDSDLAERVSDPAKELSSLSSGLWVIPLYLALCVAAPFVEEFFFRGITLRAFSHRFGSIAGIVGSSTLFGIIHFEPLQTPALIAFGVILAVAAKKTGRLGPCILGHCLFNTTTLLILTLSK